MKIIIITQNAPMYLALFFDKFLSKLKKTSHTIDGIVILSPLFSNSIIKELSDRYDYYGFVDFIKMSFLILKNKIFSLVSFIFPSVGCYSLANVLKKYRINRYSIDSINNDKFVSYIKNNQIDLVISVASSQIFKQNILSAPKKGCINCHSSILPKYRGRQPLFWSLLNGEKEVGMSVHEMDEKLDNGWIIAQQRIAIHTDDSLHSLYLRVIEIGPGLLMEAIDKINNNCQDMIVNDINKATYYGFPTKEDAKTFKLRGKKFL